MRWPARAARCASAPTRGARSAGIADGFAATRARRKPMIRAYGGGAERMNLRILIPLVSLTVALLQAAPAHASGDFTCYPAWKLAKTVFTDCDNTPMLSPANDSRVNLQLQLIDAGQAKIEPPPKTDPPAPPIADSASPFTFEDFQALIGPKPPGAPTDADSSPDYASGE